MMQLFTPKEVSYQMMTIQAKKQGRPSRMPDTETLAELYFSHTAREIAEQYGVSVSTVKGWIWRLRKAAREEVDAQ